MRGKKSYGKHGKLRRPKARRARSGFPKKNLICDAGYRLNIKDPDVGELPDKLRVVIGGDFPE